MEVVCVCVWWGGGHCDEVLVALLAAVIMQGSGLCLVLWQRNASTPHSDMLPQEYGFPW